MGFFCTYAPEDILYAANILPVRILGSHEPQNVTEPHIFGLYCPFCRDCLAQGLRGAGRGHRHRRSRRWQPHKPEHQHFSSPQYKSDMMIPIRRDWKLKGVMLHYNRGCEGLSLGIAENRLALQAAGYPVMTFEGNMGDEREFAAARTMQRIDAFMETLGIKKVAA